MLSRAGLARFQGFEVQTLTSNSTVSNLSRGAVAIITHQLILLPCDWIPASVGYPRDLAISPRQITIHHQVYNSSWVNRK